MLKRRKIWEDSQEMRQYSGADIEMEMDTKNNNTGTQPTTEENGKH